MREGRIIPKVSLMTAQEHALMGSSPEFMPEQREDWFRPQGLFEQPPELLSDIIADRTEVRWAARNVPQEIALFRRGIIAEHENIAIPFEEIDPETGQTMRDPQVFVGTWNNVTGELENVVGEVTDVAKGNAAGFGFDIPYRE